MIGFTVPCQKRISEYFDDLFEEARVYVINGYTVSDCYCCDYCNASITDDWYYCNCCNRDMCMMCYEETSDEIAIQNGAQNYKLREKALNWCKSKNSIVIRKKIPDISWHRCDFCKKNMLSECRTFFYRNCEIDCDMCEKCFYLEKNKSEIEKNKLIKYDVDNMCNMTNFGSMLNWIPLFYTNNFKSMVLINSNPNDTNYKKLCLSTLDNHDRLGYFIIDDSLDELLSELEKINNVVNEIISNIKNSKIEKY